MASTYSNLKFELIATGEQSGTWGDTTNVNLGTAIEEAIAESIDVAMSSGANTTLSLTDANTTQAARHLRLNLTGTSSGTDNCIVPTIEKPYIVNNAASAAVTVKTTSGSGISVPASTTMWLYVDGTNVVDVVTYLSSLTIGGALTSTTFNATGDTSAGDNAAMGYTATEGLILTGQGSTNDVTIKNDADADVLVIPTGTTNVDVVGDLTLSTAGSQLAIGGSVINQVQSYLTGAFTSGGNGTVAAKFIADGSVTGASGDTSYITVMALNSDITVQSVAETVGDVCTLRLEEPNITNPSATITNAATLLITGAPTEGTNNYAILVDSGGVKLANGDLTISNATPQISLTDTDTGADTLLDASSTAGSFFIKVDDNDEVASSQFQVHVDGTEKLSISATTADFQGVDLALSTAGSQLTVGTTGVDYAQIYLAGGFTSGGASTLASALYLNGSLTGANGDTTFLSGTALSHTITSQNNSETIGDISQLRLDEPVITKGTDTVTNASTLHITGAPSEGTDNYAILVDSGDVRLANGDLTVNGTDARIYLTGANTDIDMDGSANGQLSLDGNGYAFGIALNDSGAQLYTNSASRDLIFGVNETEVMRVTDGALTLSTAGSQLTIGGAQVGYTQHLITGAFTTGTGNAVGSAVRASSTMTGNTGKTSLHQHYTAGSLTTQGLTQTVNDVSTFRMDEPNITVGTGDTVTNASTLLITGAPTEGTNNYAILVDSGEVKFGSSITTTSVDCQINRDVQIGSTDAQADPQAALQVVGGSGIVSTTLSSSADDLALYNNTNCGMSIISGAGADGMIAFGDAADADIGQVFYDHADDSLTLIAAAVKAAWFYQVSIADDAAVSITPPRKGGFCLLTFGGDSTTPGNTSSGLFYYDTGSSLTGGLCTPLFSTNMTLAVAARTGTDGTDGRLNIGIQTNSVQIENRVGVTKNMQLVFI